MKETSSRSDLTEEKLLNEVPELPSFWDDLVLITKARLTFLVVITTALGYCLAARTSFNWLEFIQTLIGTGFVAAGAAVFNQLIEIQEDQIMRRTQDRPLAAGRMGKVMAFCLGMGFGLVGTVHLALAVNIFAAALALGTLLIYVLVYTPLKRKSSTCTLVGAVSGAIPPMVGWVAGGRGLDAGAWYLFGVLFFWQLPHFLSINWIYREEYEKAGFVMWSNNDESGEVSAKLSFWFSLALLLWTVLALPKDFTSTFVIIGVGICGLAMLWYSIRFLRKPHLESARGVFFCSLIYLPIVLAVLVFS